MGEPREPDRRYTRRPGAYAIIARDGVLLLTEQTACEVEIQLPGGGVDPGETPVQALHREVLEETGHRIQIRRKLGAYQRYTYMPEYDLWAHKICHIFLATPALRKPVPLEAGHKVLWRTPREAFSVLSTDGDRHMLALALGLHEVPRDLVPALPGL